MTAPFQHKLKVPKTKRRPKLPKFHFVIFANGVDDDIPGLEAAISGEAVLFDDVVYQPTDNIVITRREIFLSRAMSDSPSRRSGTIYVTHCLIKGGWA